MRFVVNAIQKLDEKSTQKILKLMNTVEVDIEGEKITLS